MIIESYKSPFKLVTQQPTNSLITATKAAEVTTSLKLFFLLHKHFFCFLYSLRVMIFATFSFNVKGRDALDLIYYIPKLEIRE